MDWLLVGEIVGGVLVALYSIWNVVNKFLDQTTHRKKKREEQEQAKRQEFEQRIMEAISPILDPIKADVKEIKEINQAQSKTLKDLTTSEKDCLRKMIMDIYHEYEDIRALPESVREQLDELYKDYKALRGNSYIDKRYARMQKWDTIPDHDMPN